MRTVSDLINPLRAPDGPGTGDGAATTETTGSTTVTELEGSTVDEDAELAAAYDRATSGETEEAAAARLDRDQRGRFIARDANERGEPLEDGADDALLEGEAEAASDDTAEDLTVPAGDALALPANWVGKDGLKKAWDALPDDLKAEVGAHQREIHQRMSQQGRTLSAMQPIAEVIGDFRHYFDGSLRDAAGNVVQEEPSEAIRFLFTVQQEMDREPVKTLLDIADRYRMREKLAEALGVRAAPGGAQPAANEVSELRSTVASLEERLAQLTDPDATAERVDMVLDRKATIAEMGRFAEAKPLWSDVAADMPYFIKKAWSKLGEGATVPKVLEYAYNAAVMADPEARKKHAAAIAAAKLNADKPNRAANARAVNVKTNGTGRGRELTEDELLGQRYDALQAQ